MDNKCFGSNGKNDCRILAVKGCPGESCSFFKTEAQYYADIQKAYRRLARWIRWSNATLPRSTTVERCPGWKAVLPVTIKEYLSQAYRID